MPDDRSIATQYRALKARLDSSLEARILIELVTSQTHAEQVANAETLLSLDDIKRIEDLALRRQAGEPLDHILGMREFYGLSFLVTKDVLSPRPETEMVVEFVLKQTRADKNIKILDLGTGSGAISIAILKHLNNARALAVDVSDAALALAKRSAVRHGVANRVSFIESDWFEKIDGRFDFILSNPPYIDTAAMAQLPKEVSHYDPAIALCGGPDGLEAYREICKHAAAFLAPDGFLVFEIGYDQGRTVPDILRKAGFSMINIYKDLAGHERMVTAQLRPKSSTTVKNS